MSITTRQIELVQGTWNHVLINTKEAGDLFYNRLFTIDPSLRSLFKGDINVQSIRLLGMITVAVNKLNNLADIIDEVRALGIRHKRYDVKAEQYAIVASALLWTLEKGLGDQWTEETKHAWVAVYTVLSTTMIDAADAA